MPKQSNDRKSPKMIDVLGEVVFRNRISRKVKFNYFSEMVSNIEMSFLDVPTVKINPKHLEAHFLSLPFANIN